MNHIDIFYSSDDGLRLYARDYPGPAADSPVVLCLPGLTRNSKDFVGLAEVLQSTHRVICPDQRGRGRSQHDPKPENYRPERYVKDMLSLLDLLDIERVTLIGTSLGGLMSMLLMAAAPQRIAAAVINDIGPVVDPQGLARIAGYVGKTVPPRNWDEAAAQAEAINGSAFPDYQRADWQAMSRELFIQEGATPVLNYDPAISHAFASATAATNLWPLFDAMPPKPMLAIRGETSDILSEPTLREMTARLPQLKSVTIPGRGHAPTLGEPQARAAILQFLADARAG
ncbi:MAG: alpha/beta hydrolase [Betaproteobacteria bacterium]|nr:alpha/beta hydrolase [Betaproteobacteria bacterium]